jgi:oligopeptide/dipeptide ABC transporter ATP-binding protein
LVSAIPRVRQDRRGRIVLRGDVPSPANPPSGCPFHPRCPHALAACRETVPPLDPPRDEPASGRVVACLRKDEI